VKRRERIVPKPVLDSGLRGALSWLGLFVMITVFYYIHSVEN